MFAQTEQRCAFLRKNWGENASQIKVPTHNCPLYWTFAVKSGFLEVPKIFPDEFPEPWASDWGEDEYGLFMGFTYKGVRQDFRWIEPGTFLMGSPEDEPGRLHSEVQFTVALSSGFWLADTTVTQELWSVVMGQNLHHSKNEKCPVDNISWNDAQHFMATLNNEKPELGLFLPNEVEWEYCCRASTTEEFSFGSKTDLSLELVNYSGSWGGINLDGRIKEVKTYDPNSWGLFEMHGNVWEWCENKLLFPEINKQFRDLGSLKENQVNAYVLRGGSWFDSGRNCRSAHSFHGEPGNRGGIGFRLACHG